MTHRIHDSAGSESKSGHCNEMDKGIHRLFFFIFTSWLISSELSFLRAEHRRHVALSALKRRRFLFYREPIRQVAKGGWESKWARWSVSRSSQEVPSIRFSGGKAGGVRSDGRIMTAVSSSSELA